MRPGWPPRPLTSSTPVTSVEPPGATADLTVRIESVVSVRTSAWAGAAVSAGTARVAATATPVATRRSSAVVIWDLLVWRASRSGARQPLQRVGGLARYIGSVSATSA